MGKIVISVIMAVLFMIPLHAHAVEQQHEQKFQNHIYLDQQIGLISEEVIEIFDTFTLNSDRRSEIHSEIRAAFSVEKLRPFFVAELNSALTDQQMSALILWISSELGQRINAATLAAGTLEAQRIAFSYREKTRLKRVVLINKLFAVITKSDSFFDPYIISMAGSIVATSKIGSAQVWTPVTSRSRLPSSA